MNTPQEFAPLLAGLRSLPATGGGALAALTRTSGSTFRRAGARMLVHADGRLLRGLSAGCPEQDIVARALEVIAAGQARVLRYDREQGGDLLLEMGCGGELEVLVEPLRDAADWAFAECIDTELQARRSGVLATLYRRDGISLPRPQRWLWTGQVLLDQIGEPSITTALQDLAPTLPARHKPSVHTLQGADILLERLLPPCAAHLFGVNASSLALARVLLQLGWIVNLIDARASVLPAGAELPPGCRLHRLAPSDLRSALHFDHRSFAVVMTHNLERDIDTLCALRGAPLAYLGAVGARRRAARLFEATGLTAADLRTPAGLDIGSETPEEIALAIAAEMLSAANGTGGAPPSATSAPIHR
jgi:xanthine/CO dehydrogenase XdhC/CoxF family maturation factor